jgi:hypothetical protein
MHQKLALSLAIVATTVSVAHATTSPSFLLSSDDGTAYESLILAQFPTSGSTNVASYLNYGRYASTDKVVALADFNDDGVLDVVLAAKEMSTNTYKWQLWLMADHGTASNGRQNYSPSKKISLTPLNGTAPDAYSASLGTIVNGAGNRVFYVKNPQTGDIRGEEVTVVGATASITGESIYSVETSEWTKTVSVFSDPGHDGLPAFLLTYKTNTIAGIYHSYNSSYQILLNSDSTSVNFAPTTHPAASLDINGDGNEDILVAPDGRARRAWILNPALNRTANLTILGARPFQIAWNVVAWGGGLNH